MSKIKDLLLIAEEHGIPQHHAEQVFSGIEFTVPGKPHGKGRPRFSHGHAYTPKTDHQYEGYVRKCYRERYEDLTFGDLPLLVSITLIFPVPKSTRKAEAAEMLSGERQPCVKPDIDNCVKSILDQMNGVCWDDDRQVVGLTVKKIYGEEPGAIIRIRYAFPESKNNRSRKL